MANLFTTREQTDYPPRQMKTPEGAHFDTITSKDVADASSSGDSVRIVSNSPAESQGGAKVTSAEDAAYIDAVKRGDMETAQLS